LPALFRQVQERYGWARGSRNLDLGGGPYDHATAYLARRGVSNVVYDPGHQGGRELGAARSWLNRGAFDTVTAANVLNVIPTAAERSALLATAARSVKPGGLAFFSVYEGNACGRGCATVRGWQANARREAYIPELERWFDDVERAGALLVAYRW
jgi:hypothetical protein